MAEPEYPLFNGRYVSWANLSVSFGDFETADFTKLDWEDALEPGLVKGKGAFARGRTDGEYTSDGSVTMLLEAATKFFKLLEAQNKSIGLVSFNITGQWSYTEGGDVHDVVLHACRIKGRKGSNAPGTDGAAIDIPLSVMGIQVDGVWLLEPPKN